MTDLKPKTVVERRSIRRSPIFLRLPYPPSLGLSGTAADVAAERYRQWCERAALLLPKFRPRLSGPVEIDLTFKEHPGRQRFDIVARGVLAFLAARGVIDDDSGRTIRKMILALGPSEGVAVEIRPAASERDQPQ